MSFVFANPEVVLAALVRHAAMTGVALLAAVLIALPLGALLARAPRVAGAVLALFGVVYTIPSLALIIFFVPLFGLDATSVVVALVLYMQVILVRNVVAGLASVDPAAAEAARAVGMSAWERFWRVELPLALPQILAGVRLAAVAGIGIATIGAKFNAGGLGTLLFEGIAQTGRTDKIWAGALAVGALALGANAAFLLLERALCPWARPARARRPLV